MYDEKDPTCYDGTVDCRACIIPYSMRQQRFQAATASSGTPGTSASYSTETDQGAAANETENTDATSRSETDTTGEGVMDGIADDVRKGVEDIKRDIMDTTESESTAETQNR